MVRLDRPCKRFAQKCEIDWFDASWYAGICISFEHIAIARGEYEGSVSVHICNWVDALVPQVDVENGELNVA
jgi:hypothetical protein